MSEFIPYLTFNGNCREAMRFYQECFGGELFFQRVGDTALAAGLPEPMQDYILQATLKADNICLMGSDMVPEQGLKRGNGVSILLKRQDEEGLQRWYEALSLQGEATQALQRTVSGELFGTLTDRYGNHWLFKT